MKNVKVEGQVVKVGDSVCFKNDYEQAGVIEKIVGNTLYIRSYEDDEIFCETVDRCWID